MYISEENSQFFFQIRVYTPDYNKAEKVSISTSYSYLVCNKCNLDILSERRERERKKINNFTS